MESDRRFQTIEFAFSETFIRRARRQILVLVLFLMLSMVPFALYVSWHVSDFKIDFERALAAAGVAILVAVVIFAIEMPLIGWRQRELRVLVDQDKLIKKCGRKDQTLFWTDIVSVTVTRNKKGLAASIRLDAAERKNSIFLNGFSNMEDMAKLITERTSEAIPFKSKCWRFNWHNPFVTMLVAGVPTIVVMFIIASLGSEAMDVFAIVCILSLGSGLLIFRPMTKFDVGYKWVEAVFAIVCLILGIYALICFLRTGEIP